MGVFLQGFFKRHPNLAVRAPVDGNPAVPWWWDHLAAQANALALAGFSAIWLPPMLKSADGAKPGSDGYAPFDDYDIGSKNQMATVPTRYGSREQLQRCVAMLRANGLDVYGDLVEHQRNGDPGNFVFRYKGAEGRPDIGRFAKNPENFVPNVPRDPNLGGPVADDFAFGRELAPINARPPGYVSNGLMDAADWLTRALDLQGYRLDDVKGLSTDFLFPFLNHAAMAGKFAVGEYFDGNPAAVDGWIFNPNGMRGRASAFDFPLRFMLAGMCNNPGRFNMADLDHAGLTGLSPLNAVTFVENHDTDLAEPVVTNKLLAYAYILTSEGYPCVYYRDYSTDPDCYGLKPQLDNLIWIHEHAANGITQQRWKDFNLFVYERLGAPGLLVALNNDPGGARTVEVATAFDAHTPLHDYTGNGPDIVTTGNGTAIITVPRNQDGRGYVCYSRQGVGGAFAATIHPVTQVFEGAGDLDLPPADPSRPIQVGRIWCRAGTPIRATMTIAGLPDQTQITTELVAPGGTVLARSTSVARTPTPLSAAATQTGFHTVSLALAQAPAGVRPAWRMSVSYTASQLLPQTTPDANIGAWSDVFRMPNAAIHSHLLPNGKVLFWGRRDSPNGTLDDHFCTPQVWDPATRTAVPTPQPKATDGSTVNLFCSGHTLLPDGRLLVAGGHFKDSMGIDQASLYDFTANTWTPLPAMNHGRWYPSAVTLADGEAVVLSGSFATSDGKNIQNNQVPQVWDGTTWRELAGFPGDGSPTPGPIELFPCLHVAPDGRVFMSGPAARSYFLDTTGTGKWTLLEGADGVRDNMRRDYAPSVMYDVGKVIYIGGGNDQGAQQTPSAEVEAIDLTAPHPAWRPVKPMHFARRQHNATLLPDGTVLVTGGTQGAGFNDLDPGSPIRAAELWDPATESWTIVAAEAVDRCYHSTAILLPDATVLSGGGGEFDIGNHTPNPDKDTHRDAQIYRPPYLFRTARPAITAAPEQIAYGATFVIGTPAPQEIGNVTLLRLASTTHTNNMNQRINFLHFAVTGGELRVTGPERPALCPPGHYMLFVLNRDGVPSVARIVHIAAPPVASAAGATPRAQGAVPGKSAARAKSGALAKSAALAKSGAVAEAAPAPGHAATLEDFDRKIRETAHGTQAVIGLTSKCPYGLGACWGGAYEALLKLDGVSSIRPIANAEDSTADVWLGDDGLPNVDRWAEQIAQTANGSYDFRGVEISVTGVPVPHGTGLVLTGQQFPAPLPLQPLGTVDKVQFDRAAREARLATPDEQAAFARLAARAGKQGPIRVTGPLVHQGDHWVLHVRALADA